MRGCVVERVLRQVMAAICSDGDISPVVRRIAGAHTPRGGRSRLEES
jgi:hypothetical protein